MKPDPLKRSHPPDAELYPFKGVLSFDRDVFFLSCEGLRVLEKVIAGGNGYPHIDVDSGLFESELLQLKRTVRWASRQIEESTLRGETSTLDIFDDVTFGILRLMKAGAIVQVHLLEGERDELYEISVPSVALIYAIESQIRRIQSELKGVVFESLSISKKWLNLIELCAKGHMPRGLRIGVRIRDRDLHFRSMPLVRALDEGAGEECLEQLLEAMVRLLEQRLQLLVGPELLAGEELLKAVFRPEASWLHLLDDPGFISALERQARVIMELCQQVRYRSPQLFLDRDAVVHIIGLLDLLLSVLPRPQSKEQ